MRTRVVVVILEKTRGIVVEIVIESIVVILEIQRTWATPGCAARHE
jgi:hypothetical protein